MQYHEYYVELTMPLIKAMQEINEKMKRENKEMKARIDKLEQAMIAMQKGLPNTSSLSSSTIEVAGIKHITTQVIY